MPFWDKSRQEQSKAVVDEVLAERSARVADLVEATEHLIQSARDLIAGDADVGVRYASSTITIWRDEITAAFQAFRDEVVGGLPDLREATRLVRSGDARIAVEKFGPLLVNIRALEARVGELKKQRPRGLSRVGLHVAMQSRPRPSLDAEAMLEILLAGAPSSDFGLVTIADTVSRLRIDEGVADLRDFQLHRGSFIESVWNAAIVIAELEKHPSPVEATA